MAYKCQLRDLHEIEKKFVVLKGENKILVVFGGKIEVKFAVKKKPLDVSFICISYGEME